MAIIFVDSNAAGLNNGTSWENAYNDLALAIQGAVDLDEIRFTFDTPVSSDLRDNITKNILVHGGFKGTESTPEERDLSTYVRTGRYVLKLIQLS